MQDMIKPSVACEIAVKISDELFQYEADNLALILAAVLDRLGHEYHVDVLKAEQTLHEVFPPVFQMLEDNDTERW